MEARQKNIGLAIVSAEDLDNRTLSALGNMNLIDFGRAFMVKRTDIADYVESLDRTYEDDTTFRDNAYPEIFEMREILELSVDPLIFIEYEDDKFTDHFA